MKKKYITPNTLITHVALHHMISASEKYMVIDQETENILNNSEDILTKGNSYNVWDDDWSN